MSELVSDPYPSSNPHDPVGHPGHLTASQQETLDSFRSELKKMGYSVRLDDATLLRFLRARKFNMQQALDMFVKSENWRKEFGVADLIKNFQYVEKPLVSKYYPQYYHKTDIDGRPVYIEQLGNVDLKKLYQITTTERMLQNLVYEYEMLALKRFPACSRKFNGLIETSCTIMDLKGVGITSIHSVYSYIRQASSISQDYYPERMGKFYLINAPWGFSSAFNLIKGYLDENTVKKIHVLGSNYKSALLEQIPAEHLPASLGGTCHCSEGCELSDAGPWHEEQWMSKV
ncbi:sec14 cytosolic factor family, phospholipid-intermembrane transfer protein Spo20/Sec14 [Schizosaccharomyces osmophilus]|uniref:Sec14 cytosolic factor family, phospholipid-intermembrane transfer protein Spo20/Sec14 n=1 Tax=Schizosaccharomyces osmophilus TaxID=2545709 RepID=A0AAF0AV60_9SCHI|nr:sec14 cytosolic factor family, phospholipid-intermembrane transfer protein Spo20/Sec14 [Schizosaccharomyces osmophilus]WBW71630.1 sec14 cytosolic factor family, phospholipid-intermembrane transfer protein Spo20/Sec14 [Schizosaccharomyces osmophilus]